MMTASAATLSMTTMIFLLLLLLPTTDALGSASTIAITDSSNTVCGILAGASPRSVQCAAIGSPRPLPALPNASFDSLSGGRRFLCGLRSGSLGLFCWNASSSGVTQKRLYGGPALLSGVSVGADHVAAAVVNNNASGIGFWRGISGGFPNFVRGDFKSLTSGRGFSCGIDVGGSGSVRCWGRRGSAVQEAFANVSMSSIVAGDSRVCGFRKDGVFTCTESSGRLGVPFGLETELSGVAIGASQNCAIRQSNGTVLCWRETEAGIATYSPANDTSFVLLAAGGNLTCGLTSANYSIVCWGTDLAAAVLPLPKILPGFCTSNQSSCQCGVFPDSETLCSVSGVICSPCNAKARDLNPSTSALSPPKKKTSRLWLVYAIVGSVGGFAGICTVLYCLMTGVCRQKRVHNSVQPTISAAPGGGQPPQGTVTSPVQSTPRTRSRIFRQGSRGMRRQRSGTSKGNGNGNNLPPSKAEPFTFDELAAATKNFSLENRVGGGSFGAVYRGKLQDGREVAIKRSESDTASETKKLKEKESQETAFRSELAFLSRLHHKHLVCLIGYCEERDERMLVYEYMSNGSLFDHLHPSDGGAAAGPVLGSWKMRINVLLDAARGIEYLHNYAVPPIIHRDIKSSNILLDGGWVAKVSDFGLSLVAAGGSDGSGEEKSPLGTVGYMDPEYYGLRQLTAKSDVYGMGVMMLETLTGRRAIYKAEGGKLDSVVDFAVREIAAGELERVLDRRTAAPAAGDAEAVELVAYTAVRCVSLEGRDRPSMADVVDNLERAAALCGGDVAAGGYSSNSIRSAD